ncbi:hypothetical protein Nepgr_028324 [Nepenthes gracilis]|uniref:Uncharacterized protein n=1 Tax=Nepenthes gracilis TaxID=150966 RepID=A0AAD3TCW6_NEPGR|nr:hypothetical protein Nepgr_028324 [Nepenthes gracilis]
MPSCSRSAQSDAHSALSPVETSNSAGRLPSDELSIAGGKSEVDNYASSNPRNEHVPLSYSKLCILKENGEWLHPFSAEDRLAALGRSFCHDEVVGSTEVGSSHDGVPADPLGGQPRPCNSIGILRKNIAEMRTKFDNPQDRLDIPPPFSIDGLSSPKDGGSSNYNLQKSKRRKKKRFPIPHI